MKTIPLSSGQFSIIDDDDFLIFGRLKWSALLSKTTRSFYAVRQSSQREGPRRFIYLHRAIMGNPIGWLVDHKDHDTLNNQRSNLRICTKHENVRNRRGADRDSQSGIRGVRWCSERKRWEVQIGLNSKKIHVGRFISKDEAVAAYAAANKRYFGDFGGL